MAHFEKTIKGKLWTQILSWSSNLFVYVIYKNQRKMLTNVLVQHDPQKVKTYLVKIKV
jgi:hypothetical protein